MPNRDIHMIAAGALGIGYYLFQNKQKNQPVTLGEILLVGGASALAGCVPDMIDVATSPNHRGIAHSVGVSGSLLRIFWDMIRDNPNLNDKEKAFWHSIIFGCGSHLVLDATTPKGLPIFM